MSYDFDLLVIGGGSGGIATARRAAEYGAKVGLAEYDRLGGTCVNRGCIPKKLMVYSSRFPQLFKDAEGYGWSPVESQLNWQKLISAVNQETIRLNGIYQKMLDNSQVTIFPNYAKFIDTHTLEVGDEKITADKILIAVGGHPVKPNIPGIEHTVVSDAMFQLPEQPKRIIVLGAGYIGVEFAGIMHGLGTEVVQLIRKDKILRGFDEDIRDEIQAEMIRQGIKIMPETFPTSIEKTAEGLAATGRIPKLEKLGLENVNVEVKNGAIVVNEYSQTSEDNIYAVGDCTDKINLTPVAINEGRAFADTVFGNKPRLMSYENVPSAVFSTPEAATVGLTELQAKNLYGETGIKVYRSKFRPGYNVLPAREDKTLMKLVVHQESGKILGAHMVGDHAAEIIQGVAIAVKMGATKADFDATVGIHPSAAEEFVTMR
jgi:glutathione reductase (NADPH)